MKKSLKDPLVLEVIAGTQHEIWAHWMSYLFTTGATNPDGSYTLPADKVSRWRKQIDTAYSELSEMEKKSDREQAEKILKQLAHFLQE